MPGLTPTDQKRITFLSLVNSAAVAVGEDAYAQATEWLEQMETDGFFAAPKAKTSSSRSSNRSQSRGSGSRSSGSSRGSSGGNRRGGGGGDFKLKNPDAPATDAQINKVLALSDGDYDEDDLAEMSMQEISDLIQELS